MPGPRAPGSSGAASGSMTPGAPTWTYGGNMSNRDTKNDLEVLATMSGCQHQTKHKEFYLAFLQDNIGPFLMDKIPMGPLYSSTEPSMTWSMAGNPTVFKLTCSHSSIARYLFVALVGMQSQAGGEPGPTQLQVHCPQPEEY